MTRRASKRILGFARVAGDFLVHIVHAPTGGSTPDPAKAAARRVAGAIDTGWMVGVSIDSVLGKEFADGHKSS